MALGKIRFFDRDPLLKRLPGANVVDGSSRTSASRVTLPVKVDPGAFSGQRQGWKPQEDPLAVHCLCVCSRSALLGDLVGVSRSMERDLLSVLLIYPRIFLCVFIAYRLVVWVSLCVIVFCYISCMSVVFVKLSVIAK